MLLLVPAFLLIGWGHSLPTLGVGLMLYSFGEWALPGLVQTSSCLSWANWCLPILSHQLLLLWCLVCPPWSPVMVRALPKRLLRVGESQQASDKSSPFRFSRAERHNHGHSAEPRRPR